MRVSKWAEKAGAKSTLTYNDLLYEEQPTKLPEAVFLANRAQLNQVEQMPAFITAALMFSVLVNGQVRVNPPLCLV